MVPGIDALLGGGIMPMDRIEVIGPPGSGKTQFVHQLLASLVVGRRDSTAVMLDVCRTFRTQRIVEMAKHRCQYQGDTSALLERIQFAKIQCHEQLVHFLSLLVDGKAPRPHMVVVDSIIRLYRFPDETEKKRGKEKLQLGEVLSKLQALSTNGVAIVVTNEGSDMSVDLDLHVPLCNA
jgi:RecA/RadA recombinase